MPPNLQRLWHTSPVSSLRALFWGIGFVLIACGAGVMAIPFLLRLDSIGELWALGCSLLPIVCNSQLAFPRQAALAFALMLLGGFVLLLGQRDALLPKDASTLNRWWHSDWRPRWRQAWWVTAFISLIVFVFTVFLAQADGLPPVELWLGSLLLVGFCFWIADRGHGHTPALTAHEVLSLVLYIALLFGLAALFAGIPAVSIPLRLTVIAAAAVLLYAAWRTALLRALPAFMVLCVVSAFALHTYMLNQWQYVYVGDEYAFWELARNIVRGDFVPSLLEFPGVYGILPMSSSMLHAESIRLFGGIYGWRVSEIVMVMLALPSVYIVGQRLGGQVGGSVAAIALLFSNVLLGLSKVGYNNLQSLPVFAAALAFAVLALERRSLLAVFLSGVFSAFTFYVYGLAIPMLPLALAWLVIGMMWGERPGLTVRFHLPLRPMGVAVGVFSIAVVMTALPRWLDLSWWAALQERTIASSEAQGLTNPFLQQMMPNFVYTLAASLWFDRFSHYIAGPHVDFVTMTLLLVGVFTALRMLLVRRFALMLVLGFVVTAFVSGGLVAYIFPSNTRMPLMVVFYAWFAAVGAGVLHSALPQRWLRLPVGVRIGAGGMLLLAIAALSTYQFVAVNDHYVQRNTTAYLFREYVRHYSSTRFFIVSPQDNNFLGLLETYDLNVERVIFIPPENPEREAAQLRTQVSLGDRVLVPSTLPNWNEWVFALTRTWPDTPPVLEADGTGTPQLYGLTVR